jgi:hypothetical protein
VAEDYASYAENKSAGAAGSKGDEKKSSSSTSSSGSDDMFSVTRWGEVRKKAPPPTKEQLKLALGKRLLSFVRPLAIAVEFGPCALLPLLLRVLVCAHSLCLWRRPIETGSRTRGQMARNGCSQVRGSAASRSCSLNQLHCTGGRHI